MSKRLFSRRPNGRFQRATLENTLGLSAPSCPSCGRLNPHGVDEPPPETCHACGAPMQPGAAAQPVEYASIEAFYDAQPARRTSGEADYGVHWHAGSRSWPEWRVSYIQATGEVYAVQLAGREGPVRVLGFAQPNPPGDGTRYYARLDRILDGWADPDITGLDLNWVEQQLAAAGEQ